MASELQFEINLGDSGKNLFRDRLAEGDFTVLIETQPPERTVDPAAAAEKLRQLENAVLSDTPGVNTALAILDRRENGGIRALEYAAGLPPENRNRHLIYVSGADTDSEDIERMIRFARENGFANLVPVSGDALPGETVRECRKRHFTESIRILQELDRAGGFFPGATVNPFQYTYYTLFGQYAKLAKKFGQGANFAVAQSGWDMLKLQSLLWYLQNRQLYYPIIARLTLLSVEKVEEINAGKHPGLWLSKDFNRILRRELRYSKNQFEAAQYRRIELQVAGCRLMGARGVEICGADTPAKAKTVISRVNAALREFTSFEQWIDEYNAYMASVEVAPFSPDFRLFDQIIHRDYPVDNPPKYHEFEPETPSFAEKLRHFCRERCFGNLPDRPNAFQRVLLRLLADGCTKCGRCRLPQTLYVCPEQCPKRLADGPCGGVRPDGSCEIGQAECVHARIARLAYQYRDYTRLENELIGQADAPIPESPSELNN